MCLFSTKTESKRKDPLDIVAEEKTYTCGAVVIPPVVRQNIGCTYGDAVLQCNTLFFPPVCYYCTADEECLVENDSFCELRKQYAVVQPLFSL